MSHHIGTLIDNSILIAAGLFMVFVSPNALGKNFAPAEAAKRVKLLRICGVIIVICGVILFISMFFT